MTLQIGLRNVLLSKLKILYFKARLSVILKVKKLLEHFTKKNCKKQTKKSLGLKKLIKRSMDKQNVK